MRRIETTVMRHKHTMRSILVRSGPRKIKPETPRSLNTIKALCACALLTILIATGCATQPVSVDPAPGPGIAKDPDSASPLNSQASQLADPPTATPSPTRVPPTPKPSLPPSPTPTDTPLPSPTPTATTIPSPTPTPIPTLRRLTQGNCCTQPFWSPDSLQVLFIDKPGTDLPAGIWALDITQLEPTPELLTERIAFYTPDLTLRTELKEDSTVIERLDGPLSLSEPGNLSGTDPLSDTESSTQTSPTPDTTWEVPSEGQPVSVSPGQKRITWQKSDYDLPVERRTTQIWVANLDGSAPQMVAELPRGGFSGWISDDVMLLSGRESREAQEQVLFTLSLADGNQVELARGKRLRGGLLSPDGAWLAYFVALDEDPAQNGIWLVRTDGSERYKLERDLFGAFQWRDTHRLLIIPLRPEAASHEIWEFDADTEQKQRLTDPGITPFKIANGDWSVSPDGQHVVFVASGDRNIWLLGLPD
jgi:Tol biopolymer transport system component